MGLLASHGFSYAERGWPVFPISRDKRPLVRHEEEGKGGLHLATLDEVTLALWDEQFPTANIALATGRVSGIVVIDCDGGEGIQNFTDLISRVMFEKPNTLMAASGGGGRHFFFIHPGAKIISRPLRLGDRKYLTGVDVRGDGGSIILPPSIHRSGEHYKWLNDIPMENFPVGLLAYCTNTKMPEHREKYRVAGDIDQAVAKHIEAVVVAPEGARNHELNRAAFIVSLIARDMRDDPMRYLDQLVNAGVSAGLDRIEARKTALSGLRGGS